MVIAKLVAPRCVGPFKHRSNKYTYIKIFIVDIRLSRFVCDIPVIIWHYGVHAVIYGWDTVCILYIIECMHKWLNNREV